MDVKLSPICRRNFWNDRCLIPATARRQSKVVGKRCAFPISGQKSHENAFFTNKYHFNTSGYLVFNFLQVLYSQVNQFCPTCSAILHSINRHQDSWCCSMKTRWKPLDMDFLWQHCRHLHQRRRCDSASSIARTRLPYFAAAALIRT